MQYQGSELDLFENATRWKSYYGRILTPHVKGDVLEVGAGIGGTTSFLLSNRVTSWTCLEPDPALLQRLQEKIDHEKLPVVCQPITGTLDTIAKDQAYDSIVYIDVLEHIESDATEVEKASERLNPGGKLVILCPAHQWLFTPFDAAIGHFRRYNKKMLEALRPPGLRTAQAGYLDATGLLASLANRVLLRTAHPNRNQILMWDRIMVPVSRIVDPCLGFRLGKSVYVVWEK